ncbi:hypothetical protein [Kineosporia sp. A_224]|uniref:hypothetical protein n=1 Tax=Kineosporia sp. A_224 TaxID=1962180 RepID=UPI000B4B179D|nr:hypothetical protein [Kineosporia sp. A_224]
MTAPSVGVRAPFGFLDAGHPADALVGRLLGALPERLADLPQGRVRVVSELRGGLRDGRWAPDRFYCSLQGRDTATGTFDAWTAHWSAGAADATWSRVPDDPKLPALATALAGPAAGAGPVEVLRYVPLRRFTYRQHGRVVKVKRRSRLDDSWRRARAVEAAAQWDRRVRVPELLGVDPGSASYTQADVPGAELADLAHGDLLGPMLAEAGAVHAAFHGLDATGVPDGPTPAAVRATTERSAAWAAWLLPDLAGVLARAVARLAAVAPGPVDARDVVTCHGDLVPSHLLGGPGEWTVIDHDLAHRGDRYRDLAMFVAGLAFDVPALADGVAADPTHARAAEAYIGGYEEVLGRRLDRDRLARHLLAAHLHHAALLATKDRVHPAAVGATASRLEAALDAVGGRR